MDREDSGVLFAGGAVVIIIVFAACLKMIKALFIQLTQVADAFSKLVASFLMGLWQFAQMAFLVGLGVGSIVAAIYFTYRYVKMVKEGTALKESVRMKLADIELSLESEFAHLETKILKQVKSMEERLNEALQKPNVAPMPDVMQIAPMKPEQGVTDESDTQEAYDAELTGKMVAGSEEMTEIIDQDEEQTSDTLEESEVNAGAIASPY